MNSYLDDSFFGINQLENKIDCKVIKNKNSINLTTK